MNLNNNKDITEKLKEYNEINKKIRDEERKKRLLKIKIFNIIKYLVIAFIVSVCIYPIFKEAKEYKDVFFTYNIVEQLDYMYNGDFTIVSPIVDENSTVTPNGLYIIKDNKNNIEFNAYKKGSNLITDYDQYLYKKYILEYLEKNKIEHIYYEDSKQENTNEDLYEIKFGIAIDSFDDIDDAVEQLMKLCKFVNKKVSKHLDFESIKYMPTIKLNDFEGYLSQDVTYYDSSYYISKIKTEYVNFIKNNDINDEKITKDIIKLFYKPKDLRLIVDGVKCVKNVGSSTIDVAINYDYIKKDYMTNFSNIIDKLNCLKEYKREYNGKLSYINYKGSLYYFDNIQKIIGNKIPYEWTMKMIQDFFDAEIIYDLDNKTIYINTGNE